MPRNRRLKRPRTEKQLALAEARRRDNETLEKRYGRRFQAKAGFHGADTRRRDRAAKERNEPGTTGEWRYSQVPASPKLDKPS